MYCYTSVLYIYTGYINVSMLDPSPHWPAHVHDINYNNNCEIIKPVAMFDIRT